MKLELRCFAMLVSMIPALVAEAAAPVVATGRAELTDAAGDVQPIVYLESTGSGPEKEVKYPAFDVTKLAVASDGKALTFTATLTTPPGRAAYEVLEFYLDVDHNPKTGITHPDDAARLAGVEFYGTLEVCLEHPTFGSTCSGTVTEKVGHSAIATLEKFGAEWMFKDTLVSYPAYGSIQEAKRVLVAGSVVEAALDYATLGVKPGQKVRLILREACAAKAQGFFPEIVLTLK